MSSDLTDDKSALVQVKAWHRQATNYCLSQCWPICHHMASLGDNELSHFSVFITSVTFALCWVLNEQCHCPTVRLTITFAFYEVLNEPHWCLTFNLSIATVCTEYQIGHIAALLSNSPISFMEGTKWVFCCLAFELSVTTALYQGDFSKLLTGSLNLRALKYSLVNKNCFFQCMGKIFCVEFQRLPLKFHTKYFTLTLKDV